MNEAIIKSILTLDNSQFKSAINQSVSTGESFKSVMKSIGGYVAGAFAAERIIEFGRQALETAHNVENLSKRLQMGAETVQSMGVMAKRAGLEYDALSGSILKANRAVAEAETGNKKLIQAFADMGIQISDLKGMTPEQVFERLTKAIHDNGGSAKATAAMYDILGRGAGQVNDVLKTLGEKSFAQLNEEMLKTGQILKDDTVKNLAATKESLEKCSTAAKDFGINLLGAWGKQFEKLGAMSVELLKSKEELDQIAESEKWVAERAAKVAEEQKKAAVAAEQHAEFMSAIAKYEEDKAKWAEKAKTDFEKLADLDKQIADTEASLSVSYADATANKTAQVNLEDTLVNLTGQRNELQKKLLEGGDKVLAGYMKELDAADALLADWDKLLAKEDQYAQELEANYVARLDDEEKINFYMTKNGGAHAKLGVLMLSGNASTEDLLKTKMEIAKTDQQIWEMIKGQADAGDGAAKATSKMEDATKALGKELTKINAFEIGRLKVNLDMLFNSLDSLAKQHPGGFANITLPDFSGLKIPDWMMKGGSAMKAGQFITSLSLLLNSLKTIDTSALSKLKDFQITLPDTSKVDMKGVIDILKATKDAKFGSVSITLDYPDTGVPLDVSNLKLDGIAESLSTIAGMKGILWT